MKREFVRLAASLLCSAAPACMAQGTTVYYQPAQPMSGLVGLTLDLNGDGQVDAQFYNASYPSGNYYATGASGVGGARLLVTPQGPYDGGSYLAALGAGFVIGGPTNEFLFWAAQNAPNGYGQAAVVGPTCLMKETSFPMATSTARPLLWGSNFKLRRSGIMAGYESAAEPPASPMMDNSST